MRLLILCSVLLLAVYEAQAFQCSGTLVKDKLGTYCYDACPAGTQPHGTIDCTYCIPGYYKSRAGNTNCKKCRPGHYASLTGSTLCAQCRPGYYQPHSGQRSCAKCARGYYSGAGATRCSKCDWLGRRSSQCPKNKPRITYHRLGCYRDSGHRDLNRYLGNNGHYNTIEKCGKACSNLGYQYFGQQYGGQCFCGNSFGRYGKKPDGDCHYKCSGNRSEKCGGFWRNSVYRTSVRRSGYIGCFKDTGNRDLQLHIGGANTIGKCRNACRSRGFQYFGQQYGGQCFCGDTFNKYGKGAEKDCHYKCSGNRREFCGGFWRNSVYSTGNSARNVRSTYMGCYRDTGNRDLWQHVPGPNNIDRCRKACYDRGFQYFGEQYGGQCFCGNDFGRYGKKPERDCHYKCSGNRGQRCGGFWRNSVYTTGRVLNKYIGCYGDSGHRDLPHYKGAHKTSDSCRAACRGFKYFGTQYSGQCFCGNSYGRYGRKPDKDCRYKCSARHSEMCGGFWRNSVYMV